MSEKYSFEYVEKVLLSIGLKLVEKEYFGANHKIDVFDKYGYFYNIKFSTIQTGISEFGKSFLPKRFSVLNKYAIKNISRWITIERKNFEFVRGDFKSNKSTTLFFKCDKCCETWNTNWSSVYSQNKGCPYCSGKRTGENNNFAKNNPELLSEWDYSKNKFSPLDFMPHSNKSVSWICEYGHSWNAQISSRTRNNENKTGCPFCRFLKVSKGEKKIEKFLLKNKIGFIFQKRFDRCVHKKPLSFDFYIPDINLCIEYQGEQHYKPVNFGGISKKKALQNFEITKTRDSIKSDFCLNSNIKLLLIPYWKISDVDDILEKIFI
jgi:hypothetical protein